MQCAGALSFALWLNCRPQVRQPLLVLLHSRSGKARYPKSKPDSATVEARKEASGNVWSNKSWV
jgi:hypothetical protein